MEIIRIRTLAGPNIFSHQPTLMMQLRLLEQDEKLFSEKAAALKFFEGLTAFGQTTSRKMRDIRTANDNPAETVKNIALGLLLTAGFGKTGGSVRYSGEAKTFEIAVEYEHEAAARFLLESAVEAVAAALENKPFDIAGKIAEAKIIAEASEPNFPPNQTAKIPLVAITGTNGKTTVTRLIAHTLRQNGFVTGTTTTDGILLNGEIIERGDTTGPASARKILENPAVEVAVLETARGGIMRRGLGWNWADIAVITNISEDHIGQDGIASVADLSDIKSLIAERVRAGGTLVLNADDAESAAVAGRKAVLEVEKKFVYFALSEENPLLKKHAEAGEMVYFVNDNQICEKRGAEITPIAETIKIPITMSGTADFQIQNALAAAAVCRVLDLSPEKIRAGFYSFQNTIHNQGRNNFYKVGKGYALIDYGHNPKAIEAICRMTARWTDKTITGIVSFPGDRSDEVIKAAGRIAAAGFNRIIVKGDVNLRGREKGEVAEMLCKLVLEAGNHNECEIVLDAAQAFEKAIREIKENEVVVFFYEKLPPVLATLEKYGAIAADQF